MHADGTPAPISHLAKEVTVDSESGEIKLVDFKYVHLVIFVDEF